MRIASLEAYGVHPDLSAAWTQHYDEALLPIQQHAVVAGKVLDGASVVGSGPTGCGKTFIGEMAATHAASRRKPSLYLVPTKALAEAKYEQFARLYGPLGMRVEVSTHDRRSGDGRITRGEFDIAVTVPEKLWAMTMDAPALLQSVGAVVVDELQLLGDPERGPCLELLLARLRSISSAQIVALSAVLSNGGEIANWLGATLVEERRRPVELRKGVWREGRFTYAEHNSGARREEDLPGPDDEDLSPLGAIAGLAMSLAGQGEPTLTFLRDRRSCVQAAQMASSDSGAASAERALEQLRQLPRTRATELLTEMLQCGVAFHNADLHFAERRLLEEAFAAGEIGCLFCTTTLAVGINLPTRNVIVEPLKWRSDLDGRAALAALSQSEFENMAGRAGRLGFGDDFGRAILLGAAGFDADSLMSRYVEGTPEPVEGQLHRVPDLQRLVLTAAVRDGQALGAAPPRFFSRLDPDESTDDAAELAEKAGLLTPSATDGTPELTGIGKSVASSGLSIATICALTRTVSDLGRTPTNMEGLILAAMSAEARAIPLPRGGDSRRWIGALESRTAGSSGWTDCARGILWSGPLRASERAASARIALLALDWAGHGASGDLEEHTGISMGRALALCGSVGWVIQSLARLAEESGMDAGDVARLEEFGESIACGLPAECLELHRLRVPSLQRDHALALYAEGYQCQEDLLEASDEELGALVPDGVLRQLRGSREPVRADECASRAPVADDAPEDEAPPERVDDVQPVLFLDEGRPDIAVVCGQSVSLRPMEFQLLSVLARQPRRCVGFDRLYDALWGSREAVEPQQIYWHRHNLAKKLMQGMPEGADPMVKTIPRRGLMLDLPTEQVVAA